jgi:hypothetical protein
MLLGGRLDFDLSVAFSYDDARLIVRRRAAIRINSFVRSIASPDQEYRCASEITNIKGLAKSA